MPFVRFRRTSRLFEVSYASGFVHREELFGGSRSELPAGEFALLCREFAAALLLARRRLKRSDAFDLTGLEAHLRRRLAVLPSESPPVGVAQTPNQSLQQTGGA